MTIQELSRIVEERIERVINGSATQYVKYEHPETEEDWTIRISNHNANPERVVENTISFVINLPEIESEDEVYSSFSVNKKSFRSIQNQFELDENGCFYENYSDIEDCLNCVLD